MDLEGSKVRASDGGLDREFNVWRVTYQFINDFHIFNILHFPHPLKP